MVRRAIRLQSHNHVAKSRCLRRRTTIFGRRYHQGSDCHRSISFVTFLSSLSSLINLLLMNFYISLDNSIISSCIKEFYGGLFYRFSARRMLTASTGASVTADEDTFLTIWWRKLRNRQNKSNPLEGDPRRAKDGVTFMPVCP